MLLLVEIVSLQKRYSLLTIHCEMRKKSARVTSFVSSKIRRVSNDRKVFSRRELTVIRVRHTVHKAASEKKQLTARLTVGKSTHFSGTVNKPLDTEQHAVACGFHLHHIAASRRWTPPRSNDTSSGVPLFSVRLFRGAAASVAPP